MTALPEDDSGLFGVWIKKSHEVKDSKIINLSKPNDARNLAHILFDYRWCSERPIKGFKSLGVRGFRQRVSTMAISRRNKTLTTDLTTNTEYIFRRHSEKVFHLRIAFFRPFGGYFVFFFLQFFSIEARVHINGILKGVADHNQILHFFFFFWRCRAGIIISQTLIAKTLILWQLIGQVKNIGIKSLLSRNQLTLINRMLICFFMF